MLTIRVTVKGLDALAVKAARAPVEATRHISLAVQKSVALIHNAAVKEAPVNKGVGGGEKGYGGSLRQSIRSRMAGPLAGVVEAFAPYSLFVHEGTRPHDIRPVFKKVLANKATGQIFGRLVHHPGTKPNPFFIRAVRNAKGGIERAFAGAAAGIAKVLQ